MEERKTLLNLLKEVKRIEEAARDSSKSHYVMSLRWTKANRWLGGCAAFLSGGAGVVLSIEWIYAKPIATIGALLAAAISVVIAFLQPSKTSRESKTAGDEYLALENDCRVFYDHAVTKDDIDLDQVRTEIQQLNQRRNDLASRSPQIERWAYKRSRKGIEDGESDYEADKSS